MRRESVKSQHGDSAIRTIDIDETSPRYAGWRVVAACFVVAMCCWGLRRFTAMASTWRSSIASTAGRRGSISSATTAYYLVTAALVVFISDAIARQGPRRVVLVGACCLCGVGGPARLRHRAVAALRRLPAHGDRRGDDARRRDQQRRGPVVRPPARTRDQPGAQRRELRRHPGGAGAGDRDRAQSDLPPRWWAPPC